MVAVIRPLAEGSVAQTLRRARALALAAGVLCGAATDAHAYCRSTTCSGECAPDENGCKTMGEPLYWASMCVGFSIQEDGSVNIPFPEIERVVEASFVTWSDLECQTGLSTLAFSRLADVACHQAEYNKGDANANAVMFQDYRWQYTDENNTLAKTTVTYDNDTGEILDADIEMNHAFNAYTTGDVDVQYDLQSILTHEIGHLIGLDHSPDFYATMTPWYDQGSVELRSLETDDVAGVCGVYPPERAAQCLPTPRGGLGDECAAAPGDGEDDGCSCATVATPRSAAGALAAAAIMVVAGGLRRRGRRPARHQR